MRAYLTVNDKFNNYGSSITAPQIFLKVLDSEEVSAIKSITASSEGTQAASVYNLSGQRLATPQKGINIVGGRKIIAEIPEYNQAQI